MNLIVRVIRSIALVLAIAVLPNRGTAVTVSGRNYVQQSGTWYFVDTDGEDWRVVPGKIEVKFREGTTAEQRDRFALEHDLVSSPVAPTEDYYRFTFDSSSDPVAVLQAVSANILVEAAEIPWATRPLGDPHFIFAKQWNSYLTRVDRALEVTTGNAGVLVAIFDFGVDRQHEDLLPTVWSNPNEPIDSLDNDDDAAWYGPPIVDDTWGWNFDMEVQPGVANHPTPVVAHGTAVAGMACAANDNDVGIKSAGGGSSASRPVRWLAVIGTDNFTMRDAFNYCLHKGVNIVNMSFLFSADESRATRAMERFSQAGGLLIGGSGNDCESSSGVFFPASHDSVLAVGAVDSLLAHWDYSCDGPELELVAPAGYRIAGHDEAYHWSTDNYAGGYPEFNPGACQCADRVPDNRYSLFGGTSSAAPQVAAVAALVWSQQPSLTAAQVKALLRRSARDLGQPGRDDLYGFGLVDAYRSVTKWGAIQQNTVWSGTIHLSGDLTISSGATLTIMPGTIVRIAATDDLANGADTARIEFNVEGALVANGTAANPIIFESWKPTTTEDWVGFYFDGQSGGGTFDHCHISRAEYAIESYVGLTVKNTVIEDCRYAGVVSQAGGALIQGCTLTDLGSFGIFLTSSAIGSTTIRNTTVDNAASAALQVQQNATLVARNSQFLNSDTGLYHSGNATLDIDSICVFSGNAIGVHFYDAGPYTYLRRSTISSNASSGILCDNASHPQIEADTLEYNGSAIYCTNASSPTIRSNVIKSNANGIGVASGSRPDIGNAGSTYSNTIAYSTSYHVTNFTDSLVLARNNCWNVGTGDCKPKTSKINGPVDTNSPICCSVSQQTAPEPELKPEKAPKVVTGIAAIVPNPFNPTTTIHYGLATRGTVEIRVFDVAGRSVRELVRGVRVAGNHQADWDGTDRRGAPVASGIYFVKMSVGRDVFTRKLALLK